MRQVVVNDKLLTPYKKKFMSVNFRTLKAETSEQGQTGVKINGVTSQLDLHFVR